MLASNIWFCSVQRQEEEMCSTHREKVPDSSPKCIIGQLPPATSIGDIALIEDTTSKVYNDGNDDDDGKNAARSHASRFMRFDPRACMLGPHNKHVVALIRVRAYKGDGRSRSYRVAIATKRKGG